ncbi:unnamed protein product [marine sediment metagenome]|uniref:Uncharacterized protein n=1 Tax=marine sediment metagenome TaxID=412755 RepID=X1VIL3_9ZZZZ
MKKLYLSVIINIGGKKLNIRILVFMAFMTLLQVKKLNIVNKKLTLSNYYSADGAVRDKNIKSLIAFFLLLEFRN